VRFLLVAGRKDAGDVDVLIEQHHPYRIARPVVVDQAVNADGVQALDVAFLAVDQLVLVDLVEQRLRWGFHRERRHRSDEHDHEDHEADEHATQRGRKRTSTDHLHDGSCWLRYLVT
jgi:hypothetical protein